MRVTPDLPAHAIFIPVQPALLGPGHMTTVKTRIEALLMTDHAVLAVQIARLAQGDAPLAIVAIDAVILDRQAMVHFGAARMMPAVPGAGGRAAGGDKRAGGGEQRNQKSSFQLHGRLLGLFPGIGA